MLLRIVPAALPRLLRTLGPASVASMSTGTFVVSQPLNYRGGARVEPADSSGTEKAFEPATGNGARGRGRGPESGQPSAACGVGSSAGPGAGAAPRRSRSLLMITTQSRAGWLKRLAEGCGGHGCEDQEAPR